MNEKHKDLLLNRLRKWFGSKKKKDEKLLILEEDEEFVSDTMAAFMGRNIYLTRSILYTLIALLITLIIWSYFGTIEQSVTAEGKVIPASEDKIIQSLDGGIISQIFVKEGQIVKQDQILVSFDKTRYLADYNSDFEQFLALSATVARLTAEAQNSDHIEFPEIVIKNKPDLVKRETMLFEARRKGQQAELTNLQNDVDNAIKEAESYKPLIKSGAVSEVEYLHTMRALAEAKQKLLEKKDNYIDSVWTDLNKNQAELLSLKDKLVALKDKIDRADLRSPVYGIVKNIHVKTVGGVINPGMDIMEIVPLSDSLLIQARIKPKDIGFIREGQSASVKVTAFDYSIYGSLQGIVEFVSPDVIEAPVGTSSEEKNALHESFYLVNIRTNKTYFTRDNKKLYITPGMSCIVQIKTGRKTVLQYMLKPIIKAKEEAMTER